MRVLDDIEAADSSCIEALVVTGNGRSEYRRLKPLANHYNEDRVLLFPSRTERHISHVGRQRSEPATERRGWDALDALPLYKSYNYTRFLLLLDSEHCESDGQAELETKIDDIATGGSSETEVLGGGAFRSEFQIGSQDTVLYTAVVGDEFGFFEDCLATVLELEWGNEISADTKDEFKSEVNRILSGGTGQSLLENARRDNLDRAFPSLSTVLQQFER